MRQRFINRLCARLHKLSPRVALLVFTDSVVVLVSCD